MNEPKNLFRLDSLCWSYFRGNRRLFLLRREFLDGVQQRPSLSQQLPVGLDEISWGDAVRWPAALVPIFCDGGRPQGASSSA